MLIDGEWVDSASGKTFETINPATEWVLAEVAYGQAEDIDRAAAVFSENVPAALEEFTELRWISVQELPRDYPI